MVSLIHILLLIIGVSCSSCSKLSYVIKQGSGQLSLLYNARDNSDILQDNNVSTKIKQKIKEIEQYKEFFYTYFNLPPGDIYNQTTFLQRDAVTYLVIRSSVSHIEAKQNCFWWLGCFPYLGFFALADAKKFAHQQEAEGESVWIRKVRAYSTLGHFSDPILSSFFYYDEFDLAELIFHELFHTIFFIDNEVDLNENMANFFARKLRTLYFSKIKPLALREKEEEEKGFDQLSQMVVLAAKKLNQLYQEQPGNSHRVLTNFLIDKFFPRIRQYCTKHHIRHCFPLEGEWNNARFAAFLTYEQHKDKFEYLFKRQKSLDLKSFLNYIQRKYQIYKQQARKGTFEAYLFN